MILVLICSNREWRTTKEYFTIKEGEVNISPFGEYFFKKYLGQDCVFFQTGIGRTRGAGACQYGIDKWNPTVVFNIGTCGGVSPEVKVLDIIIGNKTIQYDWINETKYKKTYEELTINIDNSWIDFKNLDIKIYEGVIATADQNITYKNIDILRKENVLVGDWESGAIAYICSLNKVRSCIIRGISDMPKDKHITDMDRQDDDYRKNTPIVINRILDRVIPKIFKNINEYK